MNSLFLKSVTLLVAPAQVAVAVVFFLRGHNEPGGGFIGGLLAASALALVGVAFGTQTMKKRMLLPPASWIGIGMLISLLAGLLPTLLGHPFFKGLWPSWGIQTVIAGKIKFGVPFFFDLGVFCVVLGIATAFVLYLEEER